MVNIKSSKVQYSEGIVIPSLGGADSVDAFNVEKSSPISKDYVPSPVFTEHEDVDIAIKSDSTDKNEIPKGTQKIESLTGKTDFSVTVNGGVCNINLNTDSGFSSIPNQSGVNAPYLLLSQVLSTSNHNDLNILRDKVMYILGVIKSQNEILQAKDKLNSGF